MLICQRASGPAKVCQILMLQQISFCSYQVLNFFQHRAATSWKIAKWWRGKRLLLLSTGKLTVDLIFNWPKDLPLTYYHLMQSGRKNMSLLQPAFFPFVFGRKRTRAACSASKYSHYTKLSRIIKHWCICTPELEWKSARKMANTDVLWSEPLPFLCQGQSPTKLV